MKIIKLFVLISFMCLILPFECRAYSDMRTSLSDAEGVESLQYEEQLWEIIPDEIEDQLPDELISDKVYEIFGIDFIMSKVTDMVKKAVKSTFKGFFSVLGIVLITSVFSIMRKSINGSGIQGNIFDFVCGLCVTLSVWRMLDGVWDDAFVTLENLAFLMNGMVPFMTVLYAAGGQVASAAAVNSGLFAALTLMECIIRYLLYPTIRVCFGMTIASCVGGLNMSGISKFIRTSFTMILTFIMSLLTLALNYQTTLCAGADGVSARMIRFAAGSFVPIVGGAVSEAIKTVLGSFNYIRSTVGAVGVVCILLIVLPVIIRMFAAKMVLAAVSCIAKLLDCDREAGLISEMSGLTDITLAVVISLSLMFIFNLTLMMKIFVQ